MERGARSALRGTDNQPAGQLAGEFCPVHAGLFRAVSIVSAARPEPAHKVRVPDHDVERNRGRIVQRRCERGFRVPDEAARIHAAEAEQHPPVQRPAAVDILVRLLQGDCPPDLPGTHVGAHNGRFPTGEVVLHNHICLSCLSTGNNISYHYWSIAVRIRNQGTRIVIFSVKFEL